MLQAIFEQVLAATPTRHQLYGHLPPIMKTIQVRRTRHAGHCWRSRDELISDVLLWTPHMAEQKQDNQLEHTSSSYVRIWDVVLKTCQRRWTIWRSDDIGWGISVLVGRHDDDDYISNNINSNICPVGWCCRIQTAKDTLNVCPGDDTEQSDGEIPVMLGFWGMRSTPSLPLLLGPL